MALLVRRLAMALEHTGAALVAIDSRRLRSALSTGSLRKEMLGKERPWMLAVGVRLRVDHDQRSRARAGVVHTKKGCSSGGGGGTWRTVGRHTVRAYAHPRPRA